MVLQNIYWKWKTKDDNQFLSFLEPNPDARVADLGCGDGKFAVKVMRKIGCKDIYGVDIWDKKLRSEKKRAIKTTEMDLNKDWSLKDESFDVVVSNQVLEHLWFPIRFIKNIRRTLKPNGYCVISTENLSSWDNIIALILGYTPFSMAFDNCVKIGNPLSPHNKKKKEFPSHTRVFTYEGLKCIFKENNFKVEGIKSAGYIPFNFISDFDPRHSRFLTIKARK